MTYFYFRSVHNIEAIFIHDNIVFQFNKCETDNDVSLSRSYTTVFVSEVFHFDFSKQEYFN